MRTNFWLSERKIALSFVGSWLLPSDILVLYIPPAQALSVHTLCSTSVFTFSVIYLFHPPFPRVS